MSSEIYHTPPSQEIFDDIKQAAIQIWQSYDDTHGYASEKIDSIKDLKNVGDNYMYIVAMFDSNNQKKLMALLGPESIVRVWEAIT